MRRASFYPAEYILMLFSSLWLILWISLLGAVVIGHFFADEELARGLFQPGTLYLLAAVIVVAPLHLVLYWRVRHTNSAAITTSAHRVAHAALAVYLFLVISTLVSMATWFVYSGLNMAYDVTDYSENLLVMALILLHSVLWLKFSAWHFVRVRRGAGRPRNYAVIVGSVVLALVVLGLIFPAREGRSAARDSIKEADLTAIESAIDSHVNENTQLPKDLSELKALDSEVKGRLDDYEYNPGRTGYSYELCATFAVESGDASRPSLYGYHSHGAGRQCFSRTAYGSYIDDTSTSGNGHLDDSLQQYLENSDLQTSTEL